MNNPLASSFGNFRILSEKNRAEDEKCLLDKRSEFNPGGNPCIFPSKIFVINRLEREDRWKKFTSSNKSLFQEFEVQRWEASTPNSKIKTVVDAIFDSFYQCIKSSEEECIIIMEDDCYLAEGGLEKIKEAWKDLPEDWDILIGNHYFFGRIEIFSNHLAKPKDRASTINFSIIRKTILPKIEENLHKRSIPSIRDFDHFVTSSEVQINNFTVWPMVSREIPSFSDHKQKNLDSTQKIRENSFKYLFVDQEKYYPSLEGW
jgi:GR25 family glycosyltransferase involved in LPS biosynthesis